MNIDDIDEEDTSDSDDSSMTQYEPFVPMLNRSVADLQEQLDDITKGVYQEPTSESDSAFLHDLVKTLQHQVTNQQKVINVLSHAAPQVKHRNHVVEENVKGHNLRDIPNVKVLKKRSAVMKEVSQPVTVPSQLTTSSDQVISHVHNATTNTDQSVSEVHTAQIRQAIEHPLWQDSSIPLGGLSLPIPSMGSISSSSATVHQSSSPEDDGHVLVRTSTTPDSVPSQDAALTHKDHQHIVLSAIRRGMSLVTLSTPLPRHIKEALSGADAQLWKQACLKELKAFHTHDTFTLVPLPADRRSLGSRWVFTEKSGGVKKARLVAQGHTQKVGIDYTETFAPVVRYESVRVLLSMAASFNLVVHQMDVDTAFLNSKLDQPVYVRQPPGFVSPEHPDWVWKLSGGIMD